MAKRVGLLLALSVALCARAPAQSFVEADSAPALGEHLQGTVQPAYRFVEGISDGVYGFMRDHVIRNIMPDRMTRNLIAAPRQDSAPLFADHFRDKQTRFMQRARESYPGFDETAGLADPVALRTWSSWAAEEQASVAVDALRDTLLERYQLGVFGRSTEKYARQSRNWDPGFATMAGLVGGALLYFNGLHATAKAQGWNLSVDVRAGLRVQQALRAGAATQKVAGFELSRQGVPVALNTDLGTQAGHLRDERVGLVYRLRY